MPFELIPTPQFLKEVKVLAKKYASLKNDLEGLNGTHRKSNFRRIAWKRLLQNTYDRYI
jgi:hypothetical protein